MIYCGYPWPAAQLRAAVGLVPGPAASTVLYRFSMARNLNQHDWNRITCGPYTLSSRLG